MKLNSLKVKVLTWYILATSIIIFLFSYILYTLELDNINLKTQTNLYYYAQDLHDDIIEHGLEDGFNIAAKNFKNIKLAVLKDKSIIKKTKDFDLINIQNYLSKNSNFILEEIEDEKFFGVYILPFDKPFKGTVVASLEVPNDELERVEHILVIVDPLLLILFIFVGFKLVNKILNPIESITQTVQHLDINNLPSSLKNEFKEYELKQLTQTFNEMLTRVKDGVERMDRFNSDVSHELRTPLTVINTQIELALKKDRDKEYYVKSLENISHESNKIKQIVQNMLLLTRYSKETIKDSFVLCDFNALLIDTIERFTPKADEKKITINIERFEKSIKNANSSLINIIFSNLLDNSIKYTLENKNIYLSLYVKDETIIFIIKDEGIGINEKYIEKITDRFYRIDESRNKKIEGFGLGLSIVKNVVELHNGTMQIESKKDNGTTIKVTI